MRTFSIAFMTLLLFTSCIDLNGTFVAHEKLNLVHTTVFGNEKTKKVPAGAYRTELTFSSSEKVKLTFKGDEKIEVKIKLPSRDSFPRGNGPINLPASKTGQNYDIKGFIDTNISYSQTYRDRETCTYTVYERRCTRTCDNQGNCRRTCDRVPVSRRGFQYVEYRYETTDRYVELEMVKPNQDAVVANYSGQDQDRSKVYLRQGRCF